MIGCRLVAVTQLLFDAEKLGGGLENHAVNDLLRQMHFVKPDPAIVTGSGLLQRNVKPILLFHRITAAFVVARLIRCGVQFAVGGVESFAEQSTARCAADNGIGIVVGKLAAEGRAARAQADISGSSGHGGAAGEQTHGTSKGNDE